MHLVSSAGGRDHDGLRTSTRPAAARPVLWREVTLGLAVFAMYSGIAGIAGTARWAPAGAHARDILEIERRAGVDVERSMNHWLMDHDVLRVLANYEYAFTYILSAFLLLGWLYVKRPDLYRWARTSFVVVNLIGIACFALYPVTPPRLLPGGGYADTVTRGRTFGSWGTQAVDHANTLAAMPSLHFAWALWVSVVLGVIAGSWRMQTVSLLHVVVTLAVIMATANHYLLDAAGGVVCVLVSIPVARMFSHAPHRLSAGVRIAPADAFFLYVDSAAAPQQVGGLLLLDATDTGVGTPTREELVSLVRANLPVLPRFRQRLETARRWRRPCWVEAGAIDWAWHVESHELSPEPDGEVSVRQLNAYVAELQATMLPRDRPLWRLITVPNIAGGRTAVALILHHVLADGVGTIEHAVALLEPAVDVSPPMQGAHPGRLARLGATVTGLAQLATDGRPAWRARDVESAARSYGTVELPLAEVRDVARRLDCRISELVLCLLAGGLARAGGAGVEPHDSLRVSMTLLVPRAGEAEGNATGAAMVQVPMAAQADLDRLQAIADSGSRMTSGTRALASRFVMDRVCGLLPPPVHARFARTVYGRRFFHAIVSNIPGPGIQLSMRGQPVTSVYPILPLAPGSPIAVGALGVTGRLGLGISVHPHFVPDVDAFLEAVLATYEELKVGAVRQTPSHVSTSIS